MMEENKKEKEQEHVKIYDKEMYVGQEKLKTIVLIIAVFLIGFVAGYFSREVIVDTSENHNQLNYNVELTE